MTTGVSAQATAFARASAPLVTARPIASQVAALEGHLPRWAAAQADRGAVPAATPLDNLTILLARPADTEAAFKAFLDDLQDPRSANFHHFLMPQQVGESFGPAQSDVAAVTDWLSAQGLTVAAVSPDRTRITFGGTAEAVGRAFATSFHIYAVGNTQRVSVNSEPQVPAALVPAIRAIGGLSSMHLTADERGVEATTGTNLHALTPANFNTQYNTTPVIQAGYPGAGVKVAVIGYSRVLAADIADFQTATGLSAAAAPNTIIPSGATDPGVLASDQAEQTLDVNRVMGTAPGAVVDLVVAAGKSSFSTTDGLYVAASYEVSTLNDPIMTISYSGCEATVGSTTAALWNTLFQTAAAQGISTVVASGDSGVVCGNAYADNNPTSGAAPVPATLAAGINFLCGSTYVTCVGGTTLVDTAANWTDSGTQFSTLNGHVPEGAFNEPTDGTYVEIAGSGGGYSSFVLQPAYQTTALTGNSAYASGMYSTQRLVPDIAFAASIHDGYFMCLNKDCESSRYRLEEGTSAAAPGFAGIMAMVVNRSGAMGQMNPALYKLGVNRTGDFYDATVASSGVGTCAVATPSLCNNSEASVSGYALASGYDLVTGFGSLNTYNFLLDLRPGSPYITTTYTTTTTTLPSQSAVAYGTALTASNLNASTLAGGTNVTAMGTETYYLAAGGHNYNGTATVLTVGTVLPVGSSQLLAVWQPSAANAGTYSPSSGVATITVNKSTPTVTVTAANLNPSPTVADTLTATMLAVGAGVTPTGSVQFYDGSTTLGSPVALTGGTAMLSGQTFSGVHNITAKYLGDSNYLTATSGSIAITGGTPSATIASSSSAITISRGSTTNNTTTITGTSVAGYAGSVALSCSVVWTGAGTPSDPITCALSPASLTLTAGGTASSTLTLTSTAPHAVGGGGMVARIATGTGGMLMCLLLFVPAMRRRTRKLKVPMLAVALLLAVSAVTGCSNNAPGFTDAGTTTGVYTVTVTGNYGGTANAVSTVAVTVQ